GAKPLLVVHHQYLDFRLVHLLGVFPVQTSATSRFNGNCIVTTAPPDAPFRASRLPPCAVTICCAIQSPRPLPSAFVVKYGSKMEASFSGGIPGPLSLTATQTIPSTRAALTST